MKDKKDFWIKATDNGLSWGWMTEECLRNVYAGVMNDTSINAGNELLKALETIKETIQSAQCAKKWGLTK